MSSVADGAEDMNATPLNMLSKLPPPVMQTKQGQPPVEMPNYRDLLNSVESSRGQPQGPPPAQPTSTPVFAPQPPPSQYMPQYDTMHQAPPQYDMQAPPQYMPPPTQYMQPAQPMQPPPQYAQPAPPQFDYGQYAGVGDTYDDEEPAAPREGFLKRCLRANKSALLVAAIVLLTLVFLVPRLTRIQRLATFDGQTWRLSMLGKVAAAAIAGGAYRVALLAV